MLAFGIVGSFDNQNKANPDYVNFRASYTQKEGATYIKEELNFTKCKDEDYE